MKGVRRLFAGAINILVLALVQRILERLRSLRRRPTERDPALERKMEAEREEMKREVLEQSRPLDQSRPTVV